MLINIAVGGSDDIGRWSAQVVHRIQDKARTKLLALLRRPRPEVKPVTSSKPYRLVGGIWPCVGDQYGVLLKRVGDQYGVLLVCVGDQYGVLLVCVGDQYGVLIVCVGDQYGVLLLCVGDQYGVLLL